MLIQNMTCCELSEFSRALDNCCPDLCSYVKAAFSSSPAQALAARKLEKLGHLDPGLSRTQVRRMASQGCDCQSKSASEATVAVSLRA